MVEGVDYSGDRPSGICLYGKGKRFVARYFGPGGAWKHATKAEVAAHLASGLAVVVLAEGAERDPLSGFSVGALHAKQAHAAMVAAGIPGSRPIYFAVDFQPSPKQLAPIRNYFDGAASVIGRGRTGIYAGYDVIEWAHNGDVARWFFQTYAWSDGQWSRWNNFEQYRNHQTVCGATVDLCRSKTVDFGQWPVPQQTIGDNPANPPDTTSAVTWEFTDYLTGLAGQVGDVAATLDATARNIESLT